MGFRDILIEETDDLEQQASTEALQAEITELEEQLRPFESAGWAQIAPQVQAEYHIQVGLLTGVQAFGNEPLREVRGRIQALGWLLGLPETLRHKITQLELQIEALEQESEGEDHDAT